MIKKNWKVLLITSVVTVLPVLAGLILWNQLPAQLPFHWNAQGEIDGFADKPFAVFAMPLILLAVQWLCVFATLADPKKQAHGEKMLHLVFWMIPAISIFVHMMMYMVALGKTVRVEMVMPVFMGLIFIIIGNYLPKCKQNYTIGIKIPWTLNSEENWNKTHRFAGRIWVISGFLMMLTGFFGGFWVFFAVVLAMVLAPFIYSYILHRKGV